MLPRDPEVAAGSREPVLAADIAGGTTTVANAVERPLLSRARVAATPTARAQLLPLFPCLQISPECFSD